MTTSSPSFKPVEPIAYLTVEVKQREFESRILIACHLLRAGLPVVVGQQWSLFSNAAALPPGVVLFKTVNDIQARNMAAFREAGHLVAATDEEVLICMDDQCFLMNFGLTAAQNCDLFLAQSEPHRASVAGRFPELAERIRVTGNARIDALSPKRRAALEAEARALRDQHGRYVLFNTNFGSVNSIWGGVDAIAGIWVRAGSLDPNNLASVEMFNSLIAWEQRNFEELLQLILWAVENLPEFKVVIRPHPAERKEFWLEQFSAQPRVVVMPRTPPHPWILGAELTMHTACTTGLEAVLMDHPTLNLVPTPRPDFEPITSRVNPTAKTWQEAAVAAAQFLRQGAGLIVDGKEAYAAALEKYFPDYSKGDSARTIASSLLSLLETRGVVPDPSYLPKGRGNGFQRYKRAPAMKEKMTASAEEFSALIRALGPSAGLTNQVMMQELDDSLFLLVPTR